MKKKEKNANSNQLEDKEQAYLRRVNRAIFKANNGCLRAAKQIMMGSRQAIAGKETTKMIQAKLPRDDLPEEEEIEECKRLEEQTTLQEKSAGEAGDDKERTGRGRGTPT